VRGRRVDSGNPYFVRRKIGPSLPGIPRHLLDFTTSSRRQTLPKRSKHRKDLVFEPKQFRQQEAANRLSDVQVDRFRRKLKRDESTTGPVAVRTLRDGRKSVERIIRKETVFIVPTDAAPTSFPIFSSTDLQVFFLSSVFLSS
jgi:hypothetical protein